MEFRFPNTCARLAPSLLPRLTKLHGEILIQLGQKEPGFESLNLGLQSAVDQGAQSLVWRFHVALGQNYHRARRFNQADEHWQAARELLEKLANTLHDMQLRECFLQQTAKLIPPLTASRTVKHAVGWLTTPAYDVAALL